MAMSLGQSPFKPITNLFVLGMPNGWSHIFYTWHDFASPESGARAKCPLCPPLVTPLHDRYNLYLVVCEGSHNVKCN